MLEDIDINLVNLDDLKKNSPSPTTGKINRRPNRKTPRASPTKVRPMATWEEMIGEDRLKEIFAKQKLMDESYRRLDDNKKSEVRERVARNDYREAMRTQKLSEEVDELLRKQKILKLIDDKGKRRSQSFWDKKGKEWHESTKGKGTKRSRKKKALSKKKKRRKYKY